MIVAWYVPAPGVDPFIREPMSIRVFCDHDGREWKVWDVKPYLGNAREERRLQERRMQRAAAPTGSERRGGRDRRRNAALLTPGLEAGWLCFENRSEKRRLTPIPGGWQEAPEPELEALLEHARRVPRRILTPEPPA
jgi:hypothetical protein